MLVSLEADLYCFLKLALWKWRHPKALAEISQGLGFTGLVGISNFIPPSGKNNLKPMNLKQEPHYFFLLLLLHFVFSLISDPNSEQILSRNWLALLQDERWSQFYCAHKGRLKSLNRTYGATQKNPESAWATDPSLFTSAGLKKMYLYNYNVNKSIFPYHGKQYESKEADLPIDGHLIS